MIAALFWFLLGVVAALYGAAFLTKDERLMYVAVVILLVLAIFMTGAEVADPVHSVEIL